MKRIRLTRKLPPHDLRSYYWLKKELQDFCRDNGLAISGGKLSLLDRIEEFLRTGKVEKLSKNAPAKTSLNSFSLDTRIPVGFQCNRAARDFFISQVGKSFRYTVELQNYIKTNSGLTFQEVITVWKAQAERKKSGQAEAKIEPQFEYNRFTRDFFKDPINIGKTRTDCIDAWKKVRNSKGDRKYRRSS